MGKKVVAVDGPAASGKSAVCRMAAERLGWAHFSSGLFYRLVAWLVLREMEKEGESWEKVVSALKEGEAERVEITVDLNKILEMMEEVQLHKEGVELLPKWRGEVIGELELHRVEVSKLTPVFAKIPWLRQEITELIRRKVPDRCFIDGRDVGTNIFPDACLKLFLTASAEERARRRAKQIGEDYKKILEEIKRRDELDQKRAVDPLKPAEDAQVIDTTNMGIDEVVQEVVELVEKKCIR